MADFTPIITSRGKFLVGKVPDTAYKFKINNEYSILWYMMPPLIGFLSINLPPGSYTFLFCTKEVTDQQAGEVVGDGMTTVEIGPFCNEQKATYYKDYKDGEYDLDTRRESLRTLLLAHGLNPEDNFAFLKVNE